MTWSKYNNLPEKESRRTQSFSEVFQLIVELMWEFSAIFEDLPVKTIENQKEPTPWYEWTWTVSQNLERGTSFRTWVDIVCLGLKHRQSESGQGTAWLNVLVNSLCFLWLRHGAKIACSIQISVGLRQLLRWLLFRGSNIFSGYSLHVSAEEQDTSGYLCVNSPTHNDILIISMTLRKPSLFGTQSLSAFRPPL